jgi:DNA-binding transcriptional MocR family regulator
MLGALAKHAPAGTRWTIPRGGMFVWMVLPESIDASRLVARAADEHKVLFVPGAPFHTDGTGADTARLSFALSPPEVIEDGIQRLTRAIREFV